MPWLPDYSVNFHRLRLAQITWCIWLQMLATVADPLQEPSPADDADSAVWMDVHNVKASGTCAVSFALVRVCFGA